MTERTHIIVIYTMAGGGHLAAAQALKETLEATGKHRVTLLNPYVELMPHLDLWKRLSGRASEDIYNQSIIREGKTDLYCLAYYAGILLNFKLAYKEGRQIIGNYFKKQKPDLVISVLPMLNRVIFDAVEDYRTSAPERAHTKSAVLITDWTEYGRHIWFPKGRDYYAICGTDESLKRAKSYKSLAPRALATQGILLKPSFQTGAATDKSQAKAELGLDPNLPVICMLYGAQGSWRMKEMALALSQQPPEIQVLFLCGRNEELAHDMKNHPWPFASKTIGFTNNVPLYLAASDIFVGKPGPGSVSEAVHFGLHLLLDQTMALPQEKPVLKWVKRSGGASFKASKDFISGLNSLLSQIAKGGPQPEARPNIASRQIPDVIQNILNASQD